MFEWVQASVPELRVWPHSRLHKVFNCWWWQEVRKGASVLSSKWSPVDPNGKERNSNQARNCDIMLPIVVEGRRGPPSVWLFPISPACFAICFVISKRPEEKKKSLHAQFGNAESIFTLADPTVVCFKTKYIFSFWHTVLQCEHILLQYRVHHQLEDQL